MVQLALSLAKGEAHTNPLLVKNSFQGHKGKEKCKNN